MTSFLNSFLCPPGAGVFTVNTAKEKKEALYQTLYQTRDSDNVTTAFNRHIETLTAIPEDKVALLGVCSDTGGGIMRGANWGPLYIREKLYQAGMIDKIIELGDVRVIPHLLHDKYLNDETIRSCQRALYQQESDKPVSPLSMTEAVLTHAYDSIQNFKLFALGGDHSVSYPLVKRYFQNKSAKNVALIHFDAHTDLLKERLGIDLCFGSWLTHVLPFIDNPNKVIQLGIRSSGKDKKHWEDSFSIQQYWADEIKTQGMAAICEEACDSLKSLGVEEIYISFDIDALDASFASATGTPEQGGLSLSDALLAINTFSQTFKLTGADLVEVAPLVNQGCASEPETTLNSALAISSALIAGQTNPS